MAWAVVVAQPFAARDVRAQTPDSAGPGIRSAIVESLPGRRFWIISGAALAGTMLVDEPVREFSVRHRSSTLDRWQDAGNVLGTAHTWLPVLGGSVVVAAASGNSRVRRFVATTVVSYVTGDAIEGVLKPVVGRRRPADGVEPQWLSPFNAHGRWHSFPSAHATHAWTVAAAIAAQSHNRLVSVAAYGTASLVAWSRLYADQHWASDVVAGAVIGVATGHTAARFFAARAGRVTPIVAPNTLGVHIAF